MDEDIICKNPKCKKPHQKANTILKHLAAKEDCNLFYDDHEKSAGPTMSYWRNTYIFKRNQTYLNYNLVCHYDQNLLLQ